jgi:glycosyltransferase involved in cell wall biosynthesis
LPDQPAAGLNKSQICVLIPAYNEQNRISALIAQIKQQGYSVLVVDDGSSDQTADLARRQHVECLYQQINQGKGAALQKGFQWILERPYKAVIMLDSDGQHDPAELDVFAGALATGRADLVLGNRMGAPAAMPPVRRLTNQFLSWLISCVIRQSVPDSQCGYRAISSEALKKMRLNTRHFEIESEILLEAGRLGLKILSIPVKSVYEGSSSRIRPLRDTIRFFSFLFRYLFTR